MPEHKVTSTRKPAEKRPVGLTSGLSDIWPCSACKVMYTIADYQENGWHCPNCGTVDNGLGMAGGK